MMTLQPARANASANARPRPWVEPVINAEWPLRSVMAGQCAAEGRGGQGCGDECPARKRPGEEVVSSPAPVAATPRVLRLPTGPGTASTRRKGDGRAA